MPITNWRTFAERAQAEWVQLGTENDLLITPVLTLNQLADNPQLKARQMILAEQHLVAGSLTGVDIPIKFPATPAHAARPAPQLGTDTESVPATLIA